MSTYNYLSIEEENRLRSKVEAYKLLCIFLAIIAATAIFLSIMFIVDKNKTQENGTNISEYIDLEKIAYDYGHSIYRDRNTNVLYLQIKYNSGELVMTPIINPDGTAKLYEGN